MIREKIAKLSSLIVSLSQRMDNAGLTFDIIRMLLDQLKHRPVCLSEVVEDWLEGPSHPVMDRNMDIPTGSHGLIDFNYS